MLTSGDLAARTVASLVAYLGWKENKIGWRHPQLNNLATPVSAVRIRRGTA